MSHLTEIAEKIASAIVTKLGADQILNSGKKAIDRFKKSDDKKEPITCGEELITRNDIRNISETLCFWMCITSLSYASLTLLIGKQDNRLVHSGTSLAFSMAVLAKTPSSKSENQQEIQ